MGGGWGQIPSANEYKLEIVKIRKGIPTVHARKNAGQLLENLYLNSWVGLEKQLKLHCHDPNQHQKINRRFSSPSL